MLCSFVLPIMPACFVFFFHTLHAVLSPVCCPLILSLSVSLSLSHSLSLSLSLSLLIALCLSSKRIGCLHLPTSVHHYPLERAKQKGRVESVSQLDSHTELRQGWVHSRSLWHIHSYLCMQADAHTHTHIHTHLLSAADSCNIRIASSLSAASLSKRSSVLSLALSVRNNPSCRPVPTPLSVTVAILPLQPWRPASRIQASLTSASSLCSSL